MSKIKKKGIITTTESYLIEIIQKAFPDWLVLGVENGEMIKFWPIAKDIFE